MTENLGLHAFGYAAGLATMTGEGTVLDVWYPHPQLSESAEISAELKDAALKSVAEHVEGHSGGQADSGEGHADTETILGTHREPIFQVSNLNEPITSTADAYLRLHLLSHLLVQPNTINLDGIFAHLPNNVWTNYGPATADYIDANRARLRDNGLTIYSVDKFPRMIDYVTPAGVRIGDADRVRLGAHLTPGTTVMHEGFVNFNAGTLGTSMVEGRISQGVVVGEGSDIGGGASIMGTLSGGGRERISIGQRSLLGANSGIGIAIGDDCVVEAGLYVTAGTKVALVGADGSRGTVKAVTLSGQSGLLFRRNSQDGSVEVIRRAQAAGVELNAALHA